MEQCLRAAYKFLRGRYKDDRAKLFSLVPDDTARVNKHRLELRRFMSLSFIIYWVESQNYRIIESLRLEKTSKITKSNYHSNTTVPTKPYPKVPHLDVF